jgi:hypothetical protein
MWTVFCTPEDHAAVWAWDGLRRRGMKPVELVTTESLAFAHAWEHRVGLDGAHFKIALQDHRILCSSRIRGVLNRLSAPSLALVAHAAPAEREYAASELQAFYLSWLNSMSGVVINRPSPLGLAGGWRHTSEWAIRASRAGLRAPAYRQTAHDPSDVGYSPLTPQGAVSTSVIVLRDKVFGALMPESIQSACIRMARAEGAEMLGIDFFKEAFFKEADGQWTFAHANPMPFLPIGGEPLLDYLAELFENGGSK